MPYEFEIDINTLVTINHKITLEGISRSEQEEIDRFDAKDADEWNSYRHEQEAISEVLRRAANHLALVGLVTRFQHWINRFASELPGRVKGKPLSVAKGVDVLNKELGDGPVLVTDFDELIDVRDSIIHQNATTKEWSFEIRGKIHKQQVSARFMGSQRISDPDNKYLEVGEQQLQEATKKVLDQLTWYHEKLHPQKP